MVIVSPVPMSSKFGAAFFVALIVLAVGFIFVFRRSQMSLAIVSSNPKVQVSTVCTFGTNHVYFTGTIGNRILDPLETRLSDTNANRLRCNFDTPSTVIWARFVDADYGIRPPRLVGPPVRFQARLTDTNSGVTMIPAVNARYQDYQRKFYVTGWVVRGALEAHRGSLIRIESTNGTEAVTLRVP